MTWLGACFSKVPRISLARRPLVKLQPACFEKMIFSHVFNVRKTKRIAKFDDLKPQRCEDIGIVAPELSPTSLGTFEKQAPAARFPKVPKFFGCLSGGIILFVSPKPRRLKARNFAVIFDPLLMLF